MPKRIGAIVYEGPSALNGQPIVAIVTGMARASSNSKTGPMAQVWILNALEGPIAARANGHNTAICGNCPLRRGACYVALNQAPTAVYRSYRNGSYATWNHDHAVRARGLMLRLSAYGDPAAVPIRVWRGLIPQFAGHVGYTHQWRRRPSLSQYLMASVESLEQADDAWMAGWKTFRILPAPASPLAPNEFVCPSNRGIHCRECRRCVGWRSHWQPDIAIPVHGNPVQLKTYKRDIVSHNQ